MALVHISSLSNKFVEDPHTVVKAGDIVKVKVLEVDLRSGVLHDDASGRTARQNRRSPRGGAVARAEATARHQKQREHRAVVTPSQPVTAP